MNGSFKNLFSKIREGLAYKQAKIKLDFTIQLDLIMKKNGVSRAELSRRVGKSNPYITKIMRGENNFTIDSMVAIADAVDGKIEIHITPKEEEIVAWYKSIKTAGKPIAHRRKLVVIESREIDKSQSDISLDHSLGNGENGYSIAA